MLNAKTFATFQVSQKRFGFRNNGGGSSDIQDSPFFSVGETAPGGLHYNAPYFDETDPEDRNNRQVTGSVSYFLSSPTIGSHDLKGGVEWFRSTNTGGNSQTSTGYVFEADYLTDDGGAPVLDSQGRFIPVFVPGISGLQQWLPTRGAQIDIDTTSFYFHDRLTSGKHWTFDAGLRYERVRSTATGDINAVNTDTVVPRLAATYDLKGDGRIVLQTTYGHYAGKYSENQFANNTNVGNPSDINYDYIGPAGQGLEFAPAFNLANYSAPVSGTFPTANVFFADGLHSPLTKEFTASLGSQLTPRVYAKGTYVWRKMTGGIDDFIDTTTGQTTVIRDGVDFGTYDNAVYRNADLAKRDYQALLLQGQYRVNSHLTVQGHWTMQLQNEANFEGEASNQPGVPSLLGDYPEVFNEARNFPYGRTDDFQRHKVRLWAVYNMSMGRWGGLDLTGLYRYNSALELQPARARRAALRHPARARRSGGLREPAERRRSDAVFRRARQRVVQRLLAGRSRRAVQRAAVADGPSVPEAGSAQRLQQPEADRVQHDGDARLRRPARRTGSAAELHPRRALRSGGP